MVVLKKIEKPTENVDDLVQEIIGRGASVVADKEKEKKKKKKWICFTIRITSDILSHVDHELKDRVGISRNGWILEAIQEKLKKAKE